MQVMPFWVTLIGTPDQNLFNLRTNLRYGTVILRHYLDRENGDLYRALGRYNGSLGRPEYPVAVLAALNRHFHYGRSRRPRPTPPEPPHRGERWRPAPPRVPVAGARYRGRFAPSPTGPLHFGSLVAALASYCDARAVGGEWLLRIEDVDEPRRRIGAEAQILAALERYGFAWDGGIARQSDRSYPLRRSAGAIARSGTRLRMRVHAARTRSCSAWRVGRANLSRHLPQRRACLHAPGAASAPGACASPGHVLTCNDRLQGAQRQVLARDVGDFVVKRADGLFAYQLAVVVDDAEQGITDVVRGADLLSSTPRQVLLQNLLGLPTPSYLHVPVAINAAGEKLSKQTRAAPLPDAPLPTLLAAWRFLGQEPPSCTPANVARILALGARFVEGVAAPAGADAAGACPAWTTAQRPEGSAEGASCRTGIITGSARSSLV